MFKRLIIFSSLLMLVVLPLHASAQTNDLSLESFGAVPDDAQDDAPALQAALEALARAGGGRIVFPAGQTDLHSAVSYGFLGQASSITLTGSPGTRVRIAVGPSRTAIRLANLETVLIENIDFQGTPAEPSDPLFFDADIGIVVTSCLRVVVRGCNFYGLAAGTAVFFSSSSDTSVENSSFRGCYGRAVLYSYDWRGLTVRDVWFANSGTLGGILFVKSVASPPAWIFSDEPKPLTSANAQRRIVIEGVRLEDAAVQGVVVDGGAEFFSAENLTCNVNSSDAGAGVLLWEVRWVKVEQSRFTSVGLERPGIQLNDCDIVELEDVTFAGGVSHVWSSGSTSWLTLRNYVFPASPQYRDGVRNDSGAIVDTIGLTPVANIQFASSNYTAEEQSGSATITLTRSGDISAAVTIDYSTSDASAKAPSAYKTTWRALRFAAGEGQATVMIPLIDNNVFEGPRAFNVTLSNPTDGSVLGQQNTAVVTIQDEEDKVHLQLAADKYTVSEDASEIVLTVTRTGELMREVKVDYATSDDSPLVNCATTTNLASSRCDYSITFGTLRFAVGETTKTFTVPVIDDLHVEGSESFNVNLSTPVGAAFGEPAMAAVTIADNDTSEPLSNTIDLASFFIRMQYLDFLSREPEQAGLNAWLGVLTRCPDVQNDPACDRITVSASFFGSEEFKEKGFFIYKYYMVSLGRMPTYVEITQDMSRVTGQTGDERVTKQNAFAEGWVTKPAHQAQTPDSLSDQQFVDALEQRAGVTLNNKSQWVADLASGAKTRAQVLRSIVESAEVSERFQHAAFVAMQYFGYLRRDPEAEGFNAWLNVINSNPADLRVMVNGFLNSVEYRGRFGKP